MSAQLKYRPLGSLDANGRLNQSSYEDEAYIADIGMGTTPVYEGWARPGTPTSATGWKIRKDTYSSTTLTQVQWPENALGKASADYEFIWDSRAGYTYA
jgi:hypothetical protein